VYGADHPFGRPPAGTRESIAAMSIDDLKDWHSANLAPGGGGLQVVGAIAGDRVSKALENLTEEWAGSLPAIPEYKLQDPPAGQSVYFIDMPGAKQSVIRVGKRAVVAGDPNWLKLSLANQRLGGGSSARLTQLLRIEKGYTYGAGSRLGAYVNEASPWFASTSVRSNVTLESMELIREQIVDYADTFTDADTTITKNQTIKRNARAFETLNAKMGLLNRIAKEGVSHDIIEQETTVLNGMSTADFQDVITSHIDESEMIWVIVGDGATQRERLKEFGYGDPMELDKQGRLLNEDASDN